MQKRIPTQLQKISLYIFYGLLGYMPLHIFISTVVGVNLHILELMKVLKDIVLVFGFCLLFFSSLTQPWYKTWLKNKLVWVIGAYAALTLVLALLRPTDPDAEILGVVYNTRFLVFFLYGWLLTLTFPAKRVQTAALKIVSAVGLFVVLFGIFQYLFLPNDFLTHLGFTRENGVLPAFFIDDKPDLERVMSTLRDPNSLGSHLIVAGSLVLAGLITEKISRKRWLLHATAIVLCLWFTFSRSAWLGFIFAGVIFGLLFAKNKLQITKRQLSIVGTALLCGLVVLSLGLYLGRDTYLVQNFVLHSDQSTTLEDPNELRVRFWRESLEKITDNPVGSGPGTAGLASIRNNEQGTQLNENYYLQIATEVGVVGLILFLAILIMVAIGLFQANPNNVYVWALLASFAGLALTNFLVHIWSNEAVAYTWWGLAGLYMVKQTDSSKKKPSRAGN